MRSQRLVQSLTWLIITSSASAQSFLSFGQTAPISPNGRALPGWTLSGVNHQVQLLSDRIILTPPIPGNARGALWSDSPISSEDWTAEFEFRASGQEQGTGNLNIWYTKDKSVVGTDSVYTVESFDGLALVLDQYGGTGGKLRGFLNDGTQNYKAHSSLESLAFGHCDYAYRNLGRPSKVRISNQNGLAVSIDDRECFRTDRVTLPSGYYFGITAATADNPDSFEINKFVVTSGSSASTPQQQQQAQNPDQPLKRLDRLPGSPEAVPDRSADEIRSQDDQFADLHNRLQGLTHQIANIFSEFAQLSEKLDQRHAEVMAGMHLNIPHDTINDMNHRLDSIERTVQQVQRDVEGRDYRQHINDLQMSIESIKGGVTEHLPETLQRLISASAPRMGMFVFILVAVQIMLAGAYIVYKRRRASMPKKYL